VLQFRGDASYGRGSKVNGGLIGKGDEFNRLRTASGDQFGDLAGCGGNEVGGKLKAVGKRLRTLPPSNEGS